jgi:hypothetical protein
MIEAAFCQALSQHSRINKFQGKDIHVKAGKPILACTTHDLKITGQRRLQMQSVGSWNKSQRKSMRYTKLILESHTQRRRQLKQLRKPSAARLHSIMEGSFQKGKKNSTGRVKR